MSNSLGDFSITRASALAAIGAELALAYAQQAMTAANEAAQTGAEKASELGGTAD